MVELVSCGDRLTFDEYVSMLEAHPRVQLLGPLRIHQRRLAGVATWMVAPEAQAGTAPVFFREFDRPARLIPLTAEALDAAGEEDSPARDARRPRWATRGRWSRLTMYFTPRPPRCPKLRAPRDDTTSTANEKAQRTCKEIAKAMKDALNDGRM